MGLALTKRKAPAATLQMGYLPAPTGGINTVDVATQMPPGDCIYAWNLIPAELGVRVRTGSKAWIGTFAAAGMPSSIIPYTGSKKSGSADRLFEAESGGIRDVSSAAASVGAKVVTFATTTGLAGYCISTVFSTFAGRFLVVCDEENGAYLYTESTATWVKLAADTTVLWTQSTAYLLNDLVTANGNVYKVTVAGTSSGAGGGPSGTGGAITDGTVTWAYQHAKAASAIGPSLADQRAGLTIDPANFAFVTVHGNRLCFVEKDSSRIWVLALNSVFGTATSFDMGPKMKQGGPLAGIYPWSYDGGSGMATYLVGLSLGGDLVIYQGTDPTVAGSFNLVGCWNVGGIPSGRRQCTDLGGDILVLSLIGIRSLSSLVSGKPGSGQGNGTDRDVYATGKIANLFNQLTTASKTLPGWALHVHPTDNTLLVLMPSSSYVGTQQLAMSFAGQKGWGRYRDQPMTCAGVWNGVLYFGTSGDQTNPQAGTSGGAVWQSTGNLDFVSFDGSVSTPINFSGLTSYQNENNALMKKVEFVIPETESGSPSINIVAQPLYDLSTNEPAPPAGAAGGGSNTWDAAVWDAAVWGGDYNAATPLQGASGIGRSVAIAFQGQANTRTVVVGFHVGFQVGGML